MVQLYTYAHSGTLIAESVGVSAFLLSIDLDLILDFVSTTEQPNCNHFI